MTSIKHYGILGMHWGVRRNNPRSLKVSSDSKSAGKLRKKHLSELSNDELKKLNNRLQLERQYKDLTAKETSSGKAWLKSTLKDVGTELAKKVIKDAIQSGASKAVEYATNLKNK